MSSRVKIRRLGSEIALFGLLLVIGFATVQAYWLGRKIDKQQPAIENAVAKFQKAQKVFERARKASAHANSGERFDLQDASQIRDEYLELAEFVKAREIQKALADFTRGRLDAQKVKLKQQMETWTNSWDNLTNRLSEENYFLNSERLKDFLDNIPREGPPLAMDLRQWLERIKPVSSNYLRAVEDFRINGAPLKGENFREARGALNQPFDSLLGLGRKLQADAAAIDFFVKTNLAKEILNQSQVFSDAANVDLPRAPNLDERPRFEKLFYPLVVGTVGLLILWVALCYRSLFILPLREQLSQKEAIIQQQDMFAHFSGLALKLSHEIKNFLTIVLARLYTLKKRINANTPEHADAEVIENEVSRLDRFVKNLLKVSEPSEPKLVSTNAQTLLNEAQQMLKLQLEAKSIEIKSEIESDASFQADPEQLNRVLVNLIQNAADSIEKNGVITLRARRDRRDFDGKNTKVIVLEVEDNGPGIPPGLQERLFDPFFSTKKTGTGLGLAISAQIVKKHFGTLDFESDQDRTVFRITLPRK